ncbi:MAG: DUF1653 domain-containing protein [Rickettsiales bacterium]|jgi:hypothetical protein|nr:DUF1653 domain-containing protein [Rickettsiales bacterium]
MNEIKIGEIYRHYKDPTHIYKVVALAKHSETMEDMVVYSAMYDGAAAKTWARPMSMWFETVKVPDGTKVPRFELAEGKNG